MTPSVAITRLFYKFYRFFQNYCREQGKPSFILDILRSVMTLFRENEFA